jgi:hypothetical protein
MSLRWYVETLTEERGPQTADMLLPLCPGYSRKQIQIALNNAASLDRVHLIGRVGRCGLFAHGPAPESEPEPEPLRVNSVFALGSMNGAATLAAIE